MSHLGCNKKPISAFKEEATKLHELSLGVQRAIDQAAETGDIRAAKEAFAELQIKTAEFQTFRETLSPDLLFQAKYNVEVHGPHEVSFVLPKGVSRIEMLKEAQAIVQDCDLVFPEHLNEWASDSAFKAESLTSVRIRINGNVEGGRQKTRSEQEALLEKRGLAMASVEDLAVAFAAHYIATKEPLFGWFDAATYAVRATEQHVLRFDDEGLYMSVVVNADRNRHMAIAARLE